MEKWSNFHVTVNFNKDDTGLIFAMREAVEAMATEEWLYTWLMHYSDGRQQPFDEITSLDVHTVRIRAAFEHEGKRNHGLHVHILIEIGHSTMVQISKDGIYDIFRHFVGLNPNVHVRFVKGDGEDKDFILRYLTKEVPAYRPASQLNSRLKSAFGGDREEIEVELDL